MKASSTHLHLKSLLLTAVILVWVSLTTDAQTYFGTGGPVNDDGTESDFVIEISDLGIAGLSSAYGLTEACITVTHAWMADLDIRLTAPDGTTIMLSATLGGDQDGYINTCFTMDATPHVLDGIPPYMGNYRPFSNIGMINNGHVANGTWTLRILDTYAYADAGEVLGWSLTFGKNAPAPTPFESTMLPIVLLTTDDQKIIPDDPKIDGHITIIHNDLGLPNYLSDIPQVITEMGIEVRGASSQSFPKKSFGFETRDSKGDDLEISLLGLPKEDDWILYAPYTDKSFLRDALTYKLGRDFGGYASRTVFCELFLNGDYQGVYCLEEKIKRDKNRVNISKIEEQDTTGDKLTGGYIFKVDRDDGPGSYFVSDHEGTYPNEEVRIVFEDPEGEDLHPIQKAYLESTYDAFENALYGNDFTDPTLGYRAHINVPSFVDFFIAQEFGQNVDAYRLSTFLYKDRDSVDPMIHAGPLWDFNLAYGNVDYCNCQFTYGWAYENSGGCGNTPLWWARLVEDPAFNEEVRCRYEELRQTVLSTEVLHGWIDSMANVFSPVVTRNYGRWPILGRYVWPNYFIGNTYQAEVNYLKDWVAARLAWMDENLPGECKVSNVDNADVQLLKIYPNPANDVMEVSADAEGRLTIVDMHGIEVLQMEFNPANPQVKLNRLTSGSYFVRLEINPHDSEPLGKVLSGKLIVMK